MSFSYKFITLKSGNSYELRMRRETSAHEDETTREVETGEIEGSE